ncbi:hypothetical protein I4U23_030288 [Adineta vaga]|nr:hypothetical protein I4U23_030288 [Adineta vaga]
MMIFEETSDENILQNDYQFAHYHRMLSFFDEDTLINNHFQLFTSILLCIFGIFTGILQIKILFQRYFQTKSFSQQILIRLFFDFCHLINILFTHIIIVIVHITQTSNLNLHCPLSTFCFSLASLGSISYLCLGAFYRYMNVFQKESYSHYVRHRLTAHRVIFIASISWLIVNCPKFDFND